MPARYRYSHRRFNVTNIILSIVVSFLWSLVTYVITRPASTFLFFILIDFVANFVLSLIVLSIHRH